MSRITNGKKGTVFTVKKYGKSLSIRQLSKHEIEGLRNKSRQYLVHE